MKKIFERLAYLIIAGLLFVCIIQIIRATFAEQVPEHVLVKGVLPNELAYVMNKPEFKSNLADDMDIAIIGFDMSTAEILNQALLPDVDFIITSGTFARYKLQDSLLNGGKIKSSGIFGTTPLVFVMSENTAVALAQREVIYVTDSNNSLSFKLSNFINEYKSDLHPDTAKLTFPLVVPDLLYSDSGNLLGFTAIKSYLENEQSPSLDYFPQLIDILYQMTHEVGSNAIETISNDNQILVTTEAELLVYIEGNPDKWQTLKEQIVVTYADVSSQLTYYYYTFTDVGASTINELADLVGTGNNCAVPSLRNAMQTRQTIPSEHLAIGFRQWLHPENGLSNIDHISLILSYIENAKS